MLNEQKEVWVCIPIIACLHSEFPSTGMLISLEGNPGKSSALSRR